MLKIILVVSLLLIGVGAMAEESFEGVGIVLSQKDGITHVESTLKNSPAENAGIKAQELINAVNGASIVGVDIQKVVSLIRGPAGTQVTLTIADSANLHERNLTMTRVKFVVDCFMEGNFQLSTNGAGAFRPTLVYGQIGNQYVQWSIAGNSLFATYKGEAFNLQYIQNGPVAYIMGYIHNQPIQWNSTGRMFVGYQSCIQ